MKKLLLTMEIIIVLLGAQVYAEKVSSNTTISQNEEKISKDFNSKILSKFENDKKDVIKKLEKTDKKEAIKLFNEYFEKNSNYVKKNSSNIMNDSIKYKFFEKEELNEYNNFLNKYGLELYHAGEGMFEVRTISNYYYNIFQNYLTNDYKEYLNILTKEKVYVIDGGIIISFEDLGERVIKWEKFMTKYSNADKELLSLAKEKYSIYLEHYLFGVDNTPTISRGKNPQILKENKVAFNKFIKKYPNSSTTKIIKYFQKNYKNKNIYEEINKMIKETSF